MRVTQMMLFDRYVNNLNGSLTDLMDLNMKAQTQKRINRPSDDPTGMVRVLDHRDTLRSLNQYKENISTAEGWLGRSDEALRQVSVLLTRAKELASQAATGTVSGDNREQVSYELRSLFEQMVGLANSDFEGNSIYAGHKADGKAFEEIMWMTTNDTDFASTDFTINGSSKQTVLVQFYDGGTPPAAPGTTTTLSDPDLRVRYSVDGGDSWLTDGSIGFAGGGASVTLPQGGTSVDFHSDADVKVSDATDPSRSEGTWLWLRPSARYLGDTNDAPPLVDKVGPNVSDIAASASGHFLESNVTVRIDNTSSVGMDEDINYSYSFDGGINWITGNVAQADGSPNQAVLSVGNGGILTLSNAATGQLQPGQQFVIRPRTADINIDISASERVRLNDVGRDIFGGVYMRDDVVLSANGEILTLGSSNAGVAFLSAAAPKMGLLRTGGSGANDLRNMFEVMGNLVAFAETNNQAGVQQCLGDLEKVHQQIMNSLATVGGRENRLQVSENIINGLDLNEKELLSSIEDADVSELMTELAQSQIVYESVLRTTSMIMQLNLSKFI
ncbi:flagellar hook-associated protein FlgL [Pseudodesulfovibrio tunisiensis]|uniref:flagellar hook-associated protein FlgL n=1 Tax=Pseudodesulfovibrio tunisiensis TaxID=463192 RepID=UPI001FB27C8C|nr:flagellar hook-associated protein FlgL [Pseudodesulfovibrio tunisiensis]